MTNELNFLKITKSTIMLHAEVVCLHISLGSLLALKLAINQHCQSGEVKKAIIEAETAVKTQIGIVTESLEKEQSKANSVIEMNLLKPPSMKPQ